MATISKLAAILTANISGFTAGMHSAGDVAEGFGERFKHVAEGVIEVAGLMGLGLSAEATVEYLKHTYEAIEANDRLAVSLGVTTESLGHLEYAAHVVGVSQEALTSGLVKMLKNLDGARDGSEKAAAALDKLQLSAKDFVGLSPDQAFLKIAESINHAKDRAAALHAAIDIFGKQAGAELLPLLNLSQEEFRKFAERADQSGYALNGIDSAKVALAGEQIREFQNQIQGAANALIVELAPYLLKVGEMLNEFGRSGGGMGKMVVNAFEWIVTAVAKATDYLELLGAGWDTLKSGAEYAIAGIQFGLQKVVESVVKVLDYFGVASGAAKQFAEDLKKSHDDLMKSAGAAWDDAQHHVDRFADGSNSTKVKAFFDDIKKHSNDAAKVVVEDHKNIQGSAVFGDGDGDKAAAKELKKLQDEAKKLYEETRTPLEKFQEQLDKINLLFQAGEIDPDTYSRAIQKAEDDLDKATNKKKGKLKHIEIEAPKLLEAGSADAAAFVAKFQAQQKENAKEAEQLAEQKKQTDLQRKLVDQMEDTTALYVLNWNG